MQANPHSPLLGCSSSLHQRAGEHCVQHLADMDLPSPPDQLCLSLQYHQPKYCLQHEAHSYHQPTQHRSCQIIAIHLYLGG